MDKISMATRVTAIKPVPTAKEMVKESDQEKVPPQAEQKMLEVREQLEAKQVKEAENGEKKQKESTKTDDKVISVDAMRIAFSVDEETEKVIVKVLDADSGEEIRQIPPKELLAIAKNLSEFRGRILNEIV